MKPPLAATPETGIPVLGVMPWLDELFPPRRLPAIC